MRPFNGREEGAEKDERWKKGDKLRADEPDRRRMRMRDDRDPSRRERVERRGRELRNRLDSAPDLRSRFDKAKHDSDKEESPDRSKDRKKDKK